MMKTMPADSLTNTSGNIVAGNNIQLNVSGAITNTLPPPVTVHENYGTQQQYAGCMTAGGYKESYCEGYVDQQSGSSSVISAGDTLQINAGSLTNVGRHAQARADAASYVVEQLRQDALDRAAAEAALEPSAAVLALESMEKSEADEIRDELAALVERQPEDVAALLRGWLVERH